MTEANTAAGWMPDTEADAGVDDKAADHTETDDTAAGEQDGQADDKAAGVDDAAASEGREARTESKLRKRAQKAEARVEEVTGQLTALRQQVVESTVAASGYKPDAILSVLKDGVDSLFDDEGHLDDELLRLATETAIDLYGLPDPRPKNPAQGSSGSGPYNQKPKSSWHDLVQQRS